MPASKKRPRSSIGSKTSSSKRPPDASPTDGTHTNDDGQDGSTVPSSTDQTDGISEAKRVKTFHEFKDVDEGAGGDVDIEDLFGNDVDINEDVGGVGNGNGGDDVGGGGEAEGEETSLNEVDEFFKNLADDFDVEHIPDTSNSHVTAGPSTQPVTAPLLDPEQSHPTSHSHSHSPTPHPPSSPPQTLAEDFSAANNEIWSSIAASLSQNGLGDLVGFSALDVLNVAGGQDEGEGEGGGEGGGEVEGEIHQTDRRDDDVDLDFGEQGFEGGTLDGVDEGMGEVSLGENRESGSGTGQDHDRDRDRSSLPTPSSRPRSPSVVTPAAQPQVIEQQEHEKETASSSEPQPELSIADLFPSVAFDTDVGDTSAHHSHSHSRSHSPPVVDTGQHTHDSHDQGVLGTEVHEDGDGDDDGGHASLEGITEADINAFFSAHLADLSVQIQSGAANNVDHAADGVNGDADDDGTRADEGGEVPGPADGAASGEVDETAGVAGGEVRSRSRSQSNFAPTSDSLQPSADTTQEPSQQSHQASRNQSPSPPPPPQAVDAASVAASLGLDLSAFSIDDLQADQIARDVAAQFMGGVSEALKGGLGALGGQAGDGDGAGDGGMEDGAGKGDGVGKNVREGESSHLANGRDIPVPGLASGDTEHPGSSSTPAPPQSSDGPRAQDDATAAAMASLQQMLLESAATAIKETGIKSVSIPADSEGADPIEGDVMVPNEDEEEDRASSLLDALIANAKRTAEEQQRQQDEDQRYELDTSQPYSGPTYPCLYPNCNKTFTRLYNLKSHQKTHMDERPFKCTVCPLAFSRNHDLKRHIKIHTVARPFVCQGCDKSFSRLDALKRHKNNKKSGDGCRNTPIEMDRIEDQKLKKRTEELLSKGPDALAGSGGYEGSNASSDNEGGPQSSAFAIPSDSAPPMSHEEAKVQAAHIISQLQSVLSQHNLLSGDGASEETTQRAILSALSVANLTPVQATALLQVLTMARQDPGVLTNNEAASVSATAEGDKGVAEGSGEGAEKEKGVDGKVGGEKEGDGTHARPDIPVPDIDPDEDDPP